MPPNRPPITRDYVAGCARRDRLLMGGGGDGDAKGDPQNHRPFPPFSREMVSEADFAAAVRRGLDDLRQLDEVRDLQPEDVLPLAGGSGPKR